jgi:hypothetical protein
MKLLIHHYPQAFKSPDVYFNTADKHAYYQQIFVVNLYQSLLNMGHDVELQQIDKREDNEYWYKDPLAKSGGNGPSILFWIDIVIIENVTTGKYIVLDMRDCSGSPWASDPNCVGIFLTHYERSTMAERYGEFAHKVYPFWFCDYYPNLTRSLRPVINNLKQLPKIDNLYFAGTITGVTTDIQYSYGGINIREVAVLMRDLYKDEFHLEKSRLSHEDWLKKAARFKMVLALPGHPWCSREHETLSLGLPLLTYRWKAERLFPIIPDIHYTSVEVEPRYPMGFPKVKEDGASALIEQFRKVKDQAELLSARSIAGKLHYDNYIYPTAFIRHFAPIVLPMLAQEGSSSNPSAVA